MWYHGNDWALSTRWLFCYKEAAWLPSLEEVENENIGPQAKDYIEPRHPSQSSRSGCRALAWAGERDAVVDWTLCAS